MTNETPAPITLPPRTELDFHVETATKRVQLAKARGLALVASRRAVEAKFARGDYPMIQALDTVTREHLAHQFLSEHWHV